MPRILGIFYALLSNFGKGLERLNCRPYCLFVHLIKRHITIIIIPAAAAATMVMKTDFMVAILAREGDRHSQI